MTDIEFGKHESTKVIDDNGSTKTTTIIYRDGEPMEMIKDYYEIRRQATNPLAVLANFNSFYKEIQSDSAMSEASFRIENMNNPRKSIYTVNCYSKFSR